jgi:hypothetical protein
LNSGRYLVISYEYSTAFVTFVINLNRTGDILNEDWSDGDFIFIASLCFSDNLVSAVFERCAKLKVGSIVASHNIPDNVQQHFSLLKTVSVRGSWGFIRTYILFRK